MPSTLSIDPGLYQELQDHLRSSEDEQVAFLFTAGPPTGPELRVREIFAVPPAGFAGQSHHHVALTDEVRGAVISRATELGGCLVEAHTHPGAPSACFSTTDLRGFADWVPHVRWRLGGRPYVALVFGESEFDALVWEGEEAGPVALGGIDVDGGRLEPSGLTVALLARKGRRRG